MLKQIIFSRKLTNKRLMSSTLNASKLIYSEFGDPVKVVSKVDFSIPSIQDEEIVVKMIAAPVNPADINTIQGKYPDRPSEFPAIPGNEGVGKVVKIGNRITDFSEGDRVIVLRSCLGTWQTHMVIKSQNDLLKVPKKLGIVEAATLIVNPCTAYRMLKDFANLKPGDTVIQNGANSACGQNVIQICRAWGLRSVNIVRDRPNLEELVSHLKQLGATHVVTEESIRRTDIFKSGELDKPKLALNCVGGQSALEILRYLQHGSTMVTYGGMSREPVTIPTSSLIFKDIHVRGYWMTQWTRNNFNHVDRFEMFEELISMMTNNELQGPAYQMVELNNFKEALLNTMNVKGMIGKKYILKFDK